MAEWLQTTVDKFTFRVPSDRMFTPDGIWLQAEGGSRLRLGVTDYLQQHSGDIAFISTRPPQTRLAREEEFAALETIKVNLSLPSPVAGTVVEVNVALETAPELVNQDPYGLGWLTVIDAASWGAGRESLLEPAAYLAVMRSQAEAEIGQP